MTRTRFAKNTNALKTTLILTVGIASLLGSLGRAEAGFKDATWREWALGTAVVGAGVTSTFNPAAGLFSTAAALSAYGTYQYLAKEDREVVDIIAAKPDAVAFLNGSGQITPALAKAMGLVRKDGFQSKDDKEMAMAVVANAVRYKRDVEENCWLRPGIVCENDANKDSVEPVRIATAQRTVKITPTVEVQPGPETHALPDVTGVEAVEAR